MLIFQLLFDRTVQYIRPVYDTLLLLWLILDTTSAKHTAALDVCCWETSGKVPGKCSKFALDDISNSFHLMLYVYSRALLLLMLDAASPMDAATLDRTRALPERSRKVPIIGVGC